MRLDWPPIPDAERTSLVEALLAVIDGQHLRIQQLEELVQLLNNEIAILKGEKPKPTIAPRRLNQPAAQPSAHPNDGGKRPGSAKRSQTKALIVTEEIEVPFPIRPPVRLITATKSSSFKTG